VVIEIIILDIGGDKVVLVKLNEAKSLEKNSQGDEEKGKLQEKEENVEENQVL